MPLRHVVSQVEGRAEYRHDRVVPVLQLLRTTVYLRLLAVDGAGPPSHQQHQHDVQGGQSRPDGDERAPLDSRGVSPDPGSQVAAERQPGHEGNHDSGDAEDRGELQEEGAAPATRHRLAKTLDCRSHAAHSYLSTAFAFLPRYIRSKSSSPGSSSVLCGACVAACGRCRETLFAYISESAQCIISSISSPPQG